MKYQILFSGENKNNIKLSSAEYAQRVLKVKMDQRTDKKIGMCDITCRVIRKRVLVTFTNIYFILLTYSLIRIFSVGHYENTPIQIYRKFHLQKLKIFR